MVAISARTYLTVTGNRWLSPNIRIGSQNREEQQRRWREVLHVFRNANIAKIAIENPLRNNVNTMAKARTQIIQTVSVWAYRMKKDRQAFKNPPKLIHTKLVEPEYTTFKTRM